MDNDDQGVSVEGSDHMAVAREILDFIARNPNIFGGADIYNLDFGSSVGRSGILAAVLSALRDEQRRLAVSQFVVIVPPGVDQATAFETVRSEFIDMYRALAGREVQPREAEVLTRRLSVIVVPDRRQTSVLDIIAQQEVRAAVIVVEAASYRDDAVEPYIAPGAQTPLQPEDVWAPQLHALGLGVTRLAQERSVYVALDADELSPRRPVLADLLLSIEGCGVMGANSDEATILAAKIDKWDAWVREGRLGLALQDVDRLPSALDPEKAFLRIQLLYRAGHLEQALQAIRERLSNDPELSASARVKLARIAQDANASALAGELLASAVDALDSREDLEIALATARDANVSEIEQRTADRLEALFPGSPTLQRRRLLQLVRNRDYAAAAAIARSSFGDERAAAFYEALARCLTRSDVPDYLALIAEAGEDSALAEAYRTASVSDALSRRLPVHAFELAVPLPVTSAQLRRGERLLLETLEALLLVSSQDGAWPVPQERFQAAVRALVERLASAPDNRALRMGLIALVQPSVAGTAGLALMASLVLGLASRPIELRKGGAPRNVQMDWLLERKPFLSAAFAWLDAEDPIVIGRSTIPSELVTEPADDVVSAIADYLTFTPAGPSGDTQDILNWLALGAAIGPHTSDPDYDLRLIRLVAGKLASAGDFQLARDLAEQALLNSGRSARRRRLGWFVLADVHARGGNHLEGLLAVACTLAADDGGDEEEIFQETTGVARLLRNCGLLGPARRVISQARDLLDGMGHSERYGHQLDTLELQLRQMTLGSTADEATALGSLITDVVANGRDVLRNHGLTAPVAALLGQLLRTARQRGVPVSGDADETFAELQRHAGGAMADLVTTISASMPSANDLFAVVRALGSARYSDDVGFDMRNIAIAARRALASDDLFADPEGTSFVLDLLADRGVALPAWDEAAVPAPRPATILETADTARAIARTGLSVLQAGFDENGHLVWQTSVGGEMEPPTRESTDLICEERLRRWADTFPYAYGIDESTANLFYTTTADLRLSSLPPGPVVVVADPSFQAFPPNLLFVDGEFAGRTRPMAATPSLAWLGRARQNGHLGDGRMCAWISTAVGAEGQTLPMISDRLQPTFNAYGFVVDNGPVLPAAFAGATLAVVTAHGGVHPEGRYFQVVSDEGRLRVTAAELANALRNVGVVILFVCSGGRVDKHPAANTTLGLAKQIVDRGCSAVIASPWPLDSRVPSHWLPTFLEHWTQGARLIDANFQANKIVDRGFAQDPARGLAMTLYGNPELVLAKTRPASRE